MRHDRFSLRSLYVDNLCNSILLQANMDILFLIFVTAAIFLRRSTCFDSTSILFQFQNISDGMTLISQNRSFELGFFSPGTSRNRYVGIWYKNIPVKTVVWVANRSNPINDTSGLLMIDETGNLVLLNKNRERLWSTNISKKVLNPAMELLDTGNLVLKDGNSRVYLWQSFDYPTDTLLPDMKLGIDLRTGLDRNLTSWKSLDDPSPGDLVWKIHHSNNPETIFWRGSELYHRSGPWSGNIFTNSRWQHNSISSNELVNNEDEIYYVYHVKSSITRLVMNQSFSQRQRYVWDEASGSWINYASTPSQYCTIYNRCGPYGLCDTDKMPACQCLKGFEPRWSSSTDRSYGCIRSKPLNCSSGDAFIKFDNLNLPETTHSWVDRSMDLERCKEKCLQNCSCMAYTNFDFRGRGSGCCIWFNDLMDMRPNFIGGQVLYIRMSALEVGTKHKSRVKLALIIVGSVAALLGVLTVSYYIHRRRKLKGKKRDESEELDLPLFDLSTVAIATDNFSSGNKLGKGGFGSVYKGTLVDGQEIAVKRLSKCSGQGLREFKTEVLLIAKLQHRHLVKLLGCCIHKDEKILIYEYMSNKSLDVFIFDQIRGELLDWSKRFNIIKGIARGLLYLHQDSRLKIIHRDLKTSNILLDKEMNPKISDFGLARTFGAEQSQINTNRVVGTYGYISPEYVVDGLFSVKLDVFSFGVIVLEIISGKKNRGFSHPDHDFNLLGHAWTLSMEGRPMELLDECLKESCTDTEVKRCIDAALLCVQQRPEDRPTMSSAVIMLSTDIQLSKPKPPGFFMGRNPRISCTSFNGNELHSMNSVTISLLEAR